MKLGVIADSTGTRNHGAGGTSWPAELRDLIVDRGGEIEVRNFSLEGLRWKTAHVPTGRWLIRGEVAPLQAALDAGCDALLICLGVNDRQSPDAVEDALAFKAAIPDGMEVHWIFPVWFDPSDRDETVVTAQEWERMCSVKEAIGGHGFGLNMRALFDLGFDQDKLHPTDKGKVWIANAVYMYLQRFLPLTPITRNIAWLYSLRNTDPATYEQIIGMQE